MENDSYEHGVPSWVDLGTADTDRAARFYTDLFGWDVQDLGPDAGGYRMCFLRGRPVAGLGPQQNPGPPYWTTYVTVASADDIVGKVEANGGQVYAPPMDVFTAGRMAVFGDPLAAAFAVWQAGDHKGAGIVNEHGTYCWSELLTTDPAGAIEFYRPVFGWEAETHGPNPAAGYTEFKVGGRSIAGLMQKPEMMPAEAPPSWAVYFTVDDADVAAARITELGGTIVMPPTDIEPGRFAVAVDPTGAAFCVITMKEHAH